MIKVPGAIIMKSQKKAAPAIRPVHIVARYFILKNHGKYQIGDVVLLCKNDKQVEYLVTITPSGNNVCSCPATKKCYHLTYCEDVESTREAAAAKVVDALFTQVIEVKAPPVVEVAKPVVKKEAIPARELAPLNGNRPFSLLRSA